MDLIKNKIIDYNLESLRGYAAFLVIFYHLSLMGKTLDPTYKPKILVAIEPSGHLMVLIFFVLSGYVIGISNKKQLSKSEIYLYIKKRILRLYPIYFISIIFTLLILENEYSWLTIISNFFLLQVAFTDIIIENSPSWSLHFELFYYLLFIPLSYFNINPVLIFILSICIGLLNFLLYPIIDFPLISSYFFGFSFWITGLMISRNFKNDAIQTKASLLVSLIFLLLSLKNFNVIETVFKKSILFFFKDYETFPNNIGVQGIFERLIPIIDLSFLPYCFIFILFFTSKIFKLRRWILIIMYTLPAYNFIYIAKNINDIKYIFYISGTIIFYLISLCFLLIKSNLINKISERIIRIGIWFGSISYGLYIIHFPVLILFKQFHFFSGSIFTWVVRLIIYLMTVIFMSYFLEKKFQPWIRSKFI